MGFRFRRSVKLLPGVRLNMTGSGMSFSFGPRGFRYTVGTKGTRVTAGIPGTGVSWSAYTPHGESRPTDAVPESGRDHPYAPQTMMQPVETGAIEHINALSTSDLAPVLDQAQRRFRVTWLVVAISLTVWIATLRTDSQQLILLGALYGVVFVLLAKWLDWYRRSVKIAYQMDGVVKPIAEMLSETFGDLKRCSKVWRILQQGHTWDWKRNAGATTQIKRAEVRPTFDRPACVRGKLKLPL